MRGRGEAKGEGEARQRVQLEQQLQAARLHERARRLCVAQQRLQHARGVADGVRQVRHHTRALNAGDGATRARGGVRSGRAPALACRPGSSTTTPGCCRCCCCPCSRQAAGGLCPHAAEVVRLSAG